MVEQNKENYYLALRQTQGTLRTDMPNWQPWLIFFLCSLAEQVGRLAPAAGFGTTCAEKPARPALP